MQNVTIKEIRDLIKFSGFEIEAVKRGTGLIHLFANNINDISNFRGYCVVNGIYMKFDENPTNDGTFYGYIGGRMGFQAVNA